MVLEECNVSQTIIGNMYNQRIGDGKNMKIWSDKWNPFSVDGRIKSTNPQTCRMKTVEQLIKNRCWNKNLLQELFVKGDVEDITRIPIRFQARKDILVWKDNNKGIYTVRSGYKVAKQLQKDAQTTTMQEETSNVSQQAKVGKEV